MIKSQLTLKQLEAFVCVIDTGSFRRAAAALGTTQPNISNRIAMLEDSLGSVLMHRSSGAVHLTEKGKHLLLAARAVLASAEQFLEVAGRQDLIVDRLRLGVTELIACTWLHAFLRRFRDAYPSVSVEIEVGLSAEINKQLIAGQIDLALQTGPFETDVSGTMALGKYPYIWVTRPEISKRLGPAPAMTEVFTLPILTHARHANASRQLAKMAEAENLDTDRIVYSSSLATCVQMAVDGMGFAMLPAALLHNELKSGALVAVGVAWLPQPLEFHARFHREKSHRFVEAAAQIAAEVAAQVAAASPEPITKTDHP